MWKKGLSYGKMSIAAKQLKTSLFLFSPPLRAALFSTRQQFIALSNLGLISLPKNETICLQDFVTLQHKVHAELRAKLEKLSVSVLASVRSACDEVRTH